MKIKITIEGPKGSGKTTIGMFILGVIKPLIKLYDWKNEAELIDNGMQISPTTAAHNYVVIVTRETDKVNGH